MTTTHIICCFLNASNCEKFFYKNEICNIETKISNEILWTVCWHIFGNLWKVANKLTRVSLLETAR